MYNLIKEASGYKAVSRFTGRVLFENYTEEEVIAEYVEQAKYNAKEDMRRAMNEVTHG